MAEVLFDYEKMQDDEFTLKVGNVILDVEQVLLYPIGMTPQLVHMCCDGNVPDKKCLIPECLISNHKISDWDTT